MNGRMDGQTNRRQADGNLAGRQTDRPISGRQADRHTDREVDIKTGR